MRWSRDTFLIKLRLYQKALKISQKSSKTERRQTEQTSVSGSVSHKIFDDDVDGMQNDVNSFRYHSYIM